MQTNLLAAIATTLVVGAGGFAAYEVGLFTPEATSPLQAEFVGAPGFVYDTYAPPIYVEVTNPLPTTDAIGEPTASQVCLRIDDKVPQVRGEPACQVLTLATGATQSTTWTLPTMNPGTYTLRVLNAAHDLEVRATPAIGERINGSLVDVHLHGGAEDEGGRWHWNLTVYYHNGTTPVDFMFMGPTGLPWQGNPGRFDVGNTDVRPSPGEPAVLRTLVPPQVGGGMSWHESFVWCCAQL